MIQIFGNIGCNYPIRNKKAECWVTCCNGIFQNRNLIVRILNIERVMRVRILFRESLENIAPQSSNMGLRHTKAYHP